MRTWLRWFIFIFILYSYLFYSQHATQLTPAKILTQCTFIRRFCLCDFILHKAANANSISSTLKILVVPVSSCHFYTVVRRCWFCTSRWCSGPYGCYKTSPVHRVTQSAAVALCYDVNSSGNSDKHYLGLVSCLISVQHMVQNLVSPPPTANICGYRWHVEFNGFLLTAV